MSYKVVHRPSRMLQDADYFSKLGEDTSIDPLMKHYLEFARQMYSKNTPHNGVINQDNLLGQWQKWTRVEQKADPASINLTLIYIPDNNIYPI
eukprot:7507705-Ditylum_brightwellii.AAC.1